MEKVSNIVGWITIIILLVMFLIPSVRELFGIRNHMDSFQTVLMKAAEISAIVWFIIKIFSLSRRTP
jgi:hypothetical protein